MAISEGSSTYFAYKLEQTANTEESGSGGQILRRVTGTLNLTKAEVASAEKRDDFQEVNVNHGIRSVDWNIAGEAFIGDYHEFEEALLRRDYAAISDITASSGDGFTIASGVLTRAAGGAESFIDDGLYEGLVINLSGMTGSGNNNRNLRITAMTATTLTLAEVDGGAAIVDDASANESATISVPGQATYIPSSAHTSKTFTLERHDRNTDTSDVARGCKVGSMELSVTPNSPIGQTISGIGIDRRSISGSDAPLLTSPTAAGAGASASAGIGRLRIGGTSIAVVTSLTLNADTGVNAADVAFANTSPDIFYGRAAEITGTIVFFREDNTVVDVFDNETEVTLDFYIAAPGSEPRAFKSVYMKRVKLNSADQDDPDGPSAVTASFRALKPSTATGVNETTIILQDSAVS